MSDKDFQESLILELRSLNSTQIEVLQRLSTIEAKSKFFEDCLKTVEYHGKQLVAVEQSVKSAHHRINTILGAASALGGLCGFCITLLKDIIRR